MRFPKEVPKQKAMKIFESLGFKTVRVGNHISMIRDNKDGTKTPLTMPNHKRIKGPTLRVICKQIGIRKEEFLRIYKRI